MFLTFPAFFEDVFKLVGFYRLEWISFDKVNNL